MLSHKYKVIFIHVPKCGGTSIENWLIKYGQGSSALEKYREKQLTRTMNQFPDYTLFTFIRNPYDRFISIFNHSVREDGEYFKRPVRNMAIHEYAELVKAGEYSQLSRFDWYHTLPQTVFIPNTGTGLYWGDPLFFDQQCLFIGRFENLVEDFTVFQNHIGIDTYPLGFHNYKDSTRVKDGKKINYSQFYDKSLKRLVEDIYADDFNRFEYMFEGQGTKLLSIPFVELDGLVNRKYNSNKTFFEYLGIRWYFIKWRIFDIKTILLRAIRRFINYYIRDGK